jgi:glycosyltransferase involved in cell wall biosynthesis
VAALDVDFVVAHWAIPCGWPIAAAARCPVDLVSHGQDVRWLARLPQPARGWVFAALLANARSWSFASASLRDELLACAPKRLQSRVKGVATVAAPPMEMPDVAAAAAALRRSLGRQRIAVAVGRLVAGKQVDRAMAFVAASAEFDRLVIVGDGPERARLERLAINMGVDAHFVGMVDRLEAVTWIGAADALVHASRAEGLSTVIREAEALGTRVIRLP